MNQSQFNFKRAVEERDKAIDKVQDGAREEVKEALYRAVVLTSLALQEFTTDDVWRRVEDLDVREPRLMGAVMRRVAKDGLIESTGRVRGSEMVSCHARPKMIWRRA